jgi:hypothetical protein
MRKFVLSGALTLMAAAALLMVTVGDTSQFSEAASHRDSPLITEDPTADNTDVYAFVSTEPGRGDYVSLIANYIPLEEPGEGPNYYRFSDNVLYEIMVDTDGDAEEDLTYQFDFTTKIGAITPNTFLYNTGKIGLPPNPGDPSSQYTNWNQPTSYKLTEVEGDRRSRDKTVLLQNARVAPVHIGPSSTGTVAEYEALANAAILNAPGNIRTFVGPRDEGFYVDLMGNFDLLNLRNPGVDTTSGFNVHSIALEIPKSRLADAGDTDGNIGVWASASRPRKTVIGHDGKQSELTGPWRQVSRLGNPLVNEVLIPLKAKDKFQASEPKDDAENGFADFIVNPGTSQGPAAFTPLVVGLLQSAAPPCNTPTDGRIDLDLVLLKGIPAGTLGLPGTADTQDANGNGDDDDDDDDDGDDGPVQADILRLNTDVAPTTGTGSYSPLGAFGGDVAGFPNGRRVGDDVLDIAGRAAAGGVLHLLGAANCPASLGVSDNVQENDTDYLSAFPYLGTPHQGYNHVHDHGSDAINMAAMGLGMLGILMGLAVAGPKALAVVRSRFGR